MITYSTQNDTDKARALGDQTRMSGDDRRCHS